MNADFLDEWLSPTRVARLLECPASAASGYGGSASAQVTTNVGTLAHESLQAWVESGAWLQPHFADLLIAAFDDAAARAGADLTKLRDGRVTRARLYARAAQIQELLRLAASADDIRCEIELRDEETRLYGFVDVAIMSSPGAVLDLKTGRDASLTLPPSIVMQLLIYAHLYRVSTGYLPRDVAAFTLSHGLITIEASQAAVASALDQIQEARRSSPELARPDQATCRYCARRFSCAPHWDAVASGKIIDAVEGRLTQDEVAANGNRALRVAARGGDAWITQIPEGLLPRSTATGVLVRAVRVWPEGPPELPPISWRAGPQSGIKILSVDES